jgi:glycerate 2-kinase
MPLRSTSQLREDAKAIWQAALEAVNSEKLVRQHLDIQEDSLVASDVRIPLADIEKLAIVGAGKAGAGMAAGAVESLGTEFCRQKQVHGWLNVPDDCVRDIDFVRLHGARPAGVNEPTQRGVDGANQILKIVRELGPRDVCLCLLSGGGSALLPAPIGDVSLKEKLELTRRLSAAGANIQQLNTVRKQLSRIKGGRLGQACRAGYLIVLVISDVMGDPLDVIASGPTIPDTSTPQDALDVWEQYKLDPNIAPHAHRYLTEAAARREPASQASNSQTPLLTPPAQTATRIHHQIIGNNAVAVAAACQEAERRGYRTLSEVAQKSEGDAEEVGKRLAQRALEMRARTVTGPKISNLLKSFPDCLITGGEPTVRLAPESERGRGGRNQQLVLAAYDFLRQQTAMDEPEQNVTLENPCGNLVLLSGGTDGKMAPRMPPAHGSMPPSPPVSERPRMIRVPLWLGMTPTRSFNDMGPC